MSARIDVEIADGSAICFLRLPLRPGRATEHSAPSRSPVREVVKTGATSPSWPAGGHFDDDPEAIEEPRQAQGLPRDLTGSCVRQGALRARIAKRLGAEREAPMDRAMKVRVGRIFKSIAAGLPATGSAAIAA
jgi:hypothetical protein